VNRFAYEAIKRTKPAEVVQMANKLKNNNSKGGLRDRSRDFVKTRVRDPSIKFPESNAKRLIESSRQKNNELVSHRPAYCPATRDARSHKVERLDGRMQNHEYNTTSTSRKNNIAGLEDTNTEHNKWSSQ